MAADVRRDVFQKIQTFSNAEFDNFSTASLITRTTNDITQFQSMIIMIMRAIFYAPIIGVGGIILCGRSTINVRGLLQSRLEL